MMDKLKRDVLFFLSMEDPCKGPNVWMQMMRVHGVDAVTVSHVLRVLQQEGKTHYHIEKGWIAC